MVIKNLLERAKSCLGSTAPSALGCRLNGDPSTLDLENVFSNLMLNNHIMVYVISQEVLLNDFDNKI